MRIPAHGAFGAKWEGPYIIKTVLWEGTYQLTDMDGRLIPRAWNAQHLKRDGSRNSERKYRGVQRVSSGRWSAKIEKKGKRIHLGTYDSDVQAALSYDRMARRLHGDCAKLNFPDAQPVRGLASGSALANIPGEKHMLEVGIEVQTRGSQIGSFGSTSTILDETSHPSQVRLPFEISDSTLLDANTDAKPQENVPLNDFGVTEEFFEKLWS
nr:PREDICTED: ethylene-responsive transcription factor ERF011-like [Daucus carota subsp. sativus]